MDKVKIKRQKRERRHKRIRAKIHGTKKVPRLSFFRSNKYVYGQLVDDEKGATLLGVSSKSSKGKTQTEQAGEVGKELAKKALAKKVSSVVFDRGGFSYTGKVKAFADGAREGGLKF
jgi:large subunit ribosomal protein L18